MPPSNSAAGPSAHGVQWKDQDERSVPPWIAPSFASRYQLAERFAEQQRRRRGSTAGLLEEEDARGREREEEDHGSGEIEDASALCLRLDGRRRPPEFREDGLGIPVGVRGADAEVGLNKPGRRLVGRGVLRGLGGLPGDLALNPGEVLPQEIPLAPQFV